MSYYVDIKGDFELGWRHGKEFDSDGRPGWHAVAAVELGEPGGDQGLKIPLGGWGLLWADESVTNPCYDGNPANLFTKLEADVKLKAQIPEKYITDGITGTYVLKPFKRGRAWRVEYVTMVSLFPGKYALTLDLLPDLVAKYQSDGTKIYASDRAGFYYLIVQDSQTKHKDATGECGQWLHPITRFTVREPQTYLLGFGLISPWALENSGWFVDNVRLTYEGPLDGKCTIARVPFDRVVNVFDPALGRDEYLRTCRRVWDKFGPQAITPSSDEPFLGDGLGSKQGRWWHVKKADRPALLRFAETHYASSGTSISFMAYSDPPPPPDPQPVPPLDREIISIHFQDAIEGALLRRAVGKLTGRKDALEAVTGFTSSVQPLWVKCFTLEQARLFKEAGAKYVDVRIHNDGKYDLFATNKYYEAKRLVATYADSALRHKQWVDVIEATNEDVNSNNAAKNQHVVELLINIIRVHEELGLPPLAEPNIPVGNGEESDLPYLLPLAKEIARTKGRWTYHAYWPTWNDTFFPVSEWMWFDERWMWHHEYFVSQGVKGLKLLLTEFGPCLWGGGGFLATGGWRHDAVFSGTIEQKRVKYFSSIAVRRKRWLEWNRWNNNDLEGVFGFTANQPWMKWNWFQHKKDDLIAFAGFLIGLRGG